MAGYTVRIEGLRQLDRAAGRASIELRTGLRDKLREFAEVVAEDARDIAESKGLRESGDLIAGLQPYALMGRAGVRDTARHRGYPYPARLEYEGGTGKGGARAFLNPAVEEKAPELEKRAQTLLDEIADAFDR